MYKKLTDKRDDYYKKLSRKVVQYYDIIVIKDLNLDGMKRLQGKKVSDLGMYHFTRLLEANCVIYGSELIKISRWYPSTKKCGVCKEVNRQITLTDRTQVCPTCRTEHDRDRNASTNILNEGLRLASTQ